MQPRVFNTWGFVQIFYSGKFASLVTMARWRKDYTAEKKAPGQSQQETEAAFTKMKEVHLDALYKGIALQKTLPKCHA